LKTSPRRIAVIPARGGSKRVPKKNIKEFAGVPSVIRTIEVLLASSIFDQVVVSSDSQEILDLVSNTRTEKVVRPQELSLDSTPTVPVIGHAIHSLSLDPETLICCVYPVNPFLDKASILTGLDLLQLHNEVDYVCPVVSYPYPPQRALTRNESHLLHFENPNFAWTRSQDLKELFHDAGQWYWGRAKSWSAGNAMLNNTLGIVIPRWMSQDIDTEEDWEYAELLFEVLQIRRENLKAH
jgi:pseudaminic acid cytidylyltransferase